MPNSSSQRQILNKVSGFTAFAVAVGSASLLINMTAESVAAAPLAICYRAHIQNIGWQSWVCNGATAGTTARSLRMEAIQVVINGANVCYRAHVENIGWQGSVCNGLVAGTTARSLRMEAIIMKSATR